MMMMIEISNFTRRTTESSDRSTSGGSSIVTTTGDRSRKRRADEDRSRSDLVKIPREELSGVRRGDSDMIRHLKTGLIQNLLKM